VTRVSLERALAAGRVSREWAAQRAKQWGTTSPVYANRVLGEFAASAQDSVIPLAWVEAANERWLGWRASGTDPGALSRVGVDVARGGADKTICALRHGALISELRELPGADTMAVTGHIAGLLRAGGAAVVDVIGIGAGVVDRLREQGRPVVAFNAAEATPLTDSSGELGFANCRAAAWWRLRELLAPGSGCEIALPPHDELTGELTAPSWRATSAGRIQIESKEQMRSRLGRSTDHADAVIQAFWEPPPREREYLFVYEDDYRLSPY